MTKEKILKKLNKSKDYILFTLIFILFLLPFLKEFYPTAILFFNNDYKILRILGGTGSYFFIITFTIKFYNSTNKKYFLKENLPIFLLLMYMIWTFISCFFAENKDYAFVGTPYRKEGFFTYIYYSGIFGLAYCIDSKKIKKALLYSYISIAIFTIILVQISNYANINNLVYDKDITVISFSQFNHYGYYLMLGTIFSALLFITEKNKIFKILSCLMYTFLLFFLIYNNTFGCYLALFSTLILYLTISIIKKGKKLYISLAITILIIISVFVNHGNNTNIASENIQTFAKDVKNIATINSSDKVFESAGTGRMKLWKYGMKFFLEKPILGHGPENLGHKYGEAHINSDRPHNLLIQLLTTSGIPGFLLYCSAIRFVSF